MEMGLGAGDGQRRQPGVQHQPVAEGHFQPGVRGAGILPGQGQTVTELAKAGLLVMGQDTIGQAFAHCLVPTRDYGRLDVGFAGPRALSDRGKALIERCLVETGRRRRPGSEGPHVAQSFAVIHLAHAVLATQKPGLVAAILAVTHCGPPFLSRLASGVVRDTDC
jgi:hypothetical protein